MQVVLVGYVVAWTMPLLPSPAGLPARWGELLLGFVVVCAGFAGYLTADLGAGPAKGAALAFDPPVRFRWGYSVVQVTGALVRWLLGASLGPGTVLVVLLVGPVVDRLLAVLRRRGGPRTGPVQPSGRPPPIPEPRRRARARLRGQLRCRATRQVRTAVTTTATIVTP